jgi:hypothetical protein
MASPNDIVKLVARSRDRDALIRALVDHDIDTGCTSTRRTAEGVVEIEGFAQSSVAESLMSALATQVPDAVVDIVENVTDTFADKLRQIGEGSRFKGLATGAPRGLGTKE